MPGGELLYPSPQHQRATPPQQPHTYDNNNRLWIHAIGKGILFDHATGVVVGETAVIEDNVSILHHVTLGRTGISGGDRHPKISDGVITVVGNPDRLVGGKEKPSRHSRHEDVPGESMQSYFFLYLNPDYKQINLLSVSLFSINFKVLFDSVYDFMVRNRSFVFSYGFCFGN
ncbi:hypothetical protein MKX03_031809 [Papaver bracteatum]|nr:hypothetical protein MKX03_031809 [Papaver bracteatum]